MIMQHALYLTSEEAAAYLRIKERKLYDLVSTGAIPCSKVTGKWLFPRAALDQWVASGLVGKQGLRAPAPAIIGGSNDPLLEWAARRSQSGLALLSEGSEAGIERLERDEVVIAAIHLHDDGNEDDANIVTIAGHPALHDAVVIAFARREQGLLLPPGNPLGLHGLGDVIGARARFGMRQKGAGALLLLSRLLRAEAASLASLNTASKPYPTGQDVALAVRAGEIDCGIATRAVATAQGLDFAPLAWENFDLVMRQRSYFDDGTQVLVALLREPLFARQAAVMGGYDVSQAGKVRLRR